jgi:hypothetical protein
VLQTDMGQEMEWRRASRAALCALGGALLWTVGVGAEPLASVELTGNCPSEAELGSALGARRLPDEARNFKLVLVEVPGGARITLARVAAETVLERSVTSTDCQALADAAALIVEGYFVELAARTPVPSALAESAPAAGKPTPPAPAAKPLPPRAPPGTPPAPPHSPGPAPPSKGGMPFRIALAGGAELYPEHGNVAAAGQLGLGLGLTSVLELEAHALLTTSTTSGSPPDRVSRVERRAAVRAFGWLGGTPALAVWGGLGAAFTSVEALDVAQSSPKLVVSPLVEGGFTLRQPLGGGVAFEGELGCHVLLTQENYLVAPDGSIGRGPRLACALLAGGSWSTP